MTMTTMGRWALVTKRCCYLGKTLFHSAQHAHAGGPTLHQAVKLTQFYNRTYVSHQVVGPTEVALEVTAAIDAFRKLLTDVRESTRVAV